MTDSVSSGWSVNVSEFCLRVGRTLTKVDARVAAQGLDRGRSAVMCSTLDSRSPCVHQVLLRQNKGAAARYLGPEAVPRGAVMFDAHSAVPPATLIQLASAIKPYDLLFIEEPGVPGNIEVFKRLKAKIDIPLFLIHEFYPENAGFNLPRVTKMAYEVDKDGYIGLPPGPGLGVEVDEPRLADEAKKPQKYKWPGATLKDGSVADY